MTNEIQYEEVPQDDLRDDQLYVINAAKSIPSSEVGATAVAVKGLYDVGKTIPSAAKYIPQIISEMAKNRAAIPEVTVGPITTEDGVEIPKVDSVGKSANAVENWGKTQHIDPATGKSIPYQGGGHYAEEHKLQMTAKEAAERKAALDRINMLFEEAPKPTTPTAPAVSAMPEGRFIPELAHLPQGSPEYFEALDKYMAGQPVEPPKVTPLTPAQRAMQVAKGIGKFVEPAYKGIDYLNTQINKVPGANNALKYLGIYGTANQGSEAIKHGMHGNYGRAALDALGGVGDLAAMYGVHPGVRLAGLGVGLAAPYISKKLDEKYGRNYATGGLVYLGK